MKKSIKWIFAVLLILIFFSIWYNWRYSMGIASPYTVNDINSNNKLLLITQKSDYKDEVTSSITEALKGKNVFVSVIDVTAIQKARISDFDAFLLLHTYEMWKPPFQVDQFLNQSAQRDNIFIIATSGGGDLLPEGVDGITSASILESKDHEVSKAIEWIEGQFDIKI